MNDPTPKGRRLTTTIIDDPVRATEPVPPPDPRVASLASPDAQARALEAERLTLLAEDAERNGKRYIAGVLRKRVEKMIGRASVSEARARGAEEANRVRYPVDPDAPIPPAATS